MFSLKPSVPILGPCTVGSTEFEIPISEIETQTSPPDPDINTIKFRLYYPTDTPYNGQTVPWVPEPQKQWTAAFGRFLGSSLGFPSLVNPLLSLATYFTIPAIPNARLKPSSAPYPLLVFSHGLAGNCNTYSSLCGSLASCGIIVAAAEHRDGSSVVSMLRNSSGNIASEISYRKYAHTATDDVFDARNAQLRIRLWELDLMYAVLGKLNSGEELSNYALAGKRDTSPTLKSTMDMAPGRVTWVGHSFGAATVTQFVKSIYYRASLPSLVGTIHEHNPAYKPLYIPRSGSALIEQIMPSSPVALLDVWTMPFRAPSAQWLWERPMPCYDITPTSKSPSTGPTTVSVMSTEFHVWTELLNRTLALLSADPLKAAKQQQQSAPRSPKTPPADESLLKTPTFHTPPNKQDDKAAEYDNDLLPPASLPIDDNYTTAPSPADPIDRSTTNTPLSITSVSSSSNTTNSITESSFPNSANTSTTSLSPSLTAKAAPTSTSTSALNTDTIPTTPSQPAALYHIPSTAHLSQSDFGPLFPTLTRLLNKAHDPKGAMALNVRAVAQAMRNAGVRGVRRVDAEELQVKAAGRWGGWFGGSAEAAERQDGEARDGEQEAVVDRILQMGGRLDEDAKKTAAAVAGRDVLERWVELPIPDVR